MDNPTARMLMATWYAFGQMDAAPDPRLDGNDALIFGEQQYNTRLAHDEHEKVHLPSVQDAWQEYKAAKK